MTCPRCFAEFERGAAGTCPECGVTLVRNVSGVMKTSAVMIAAGDEHGFYHSVQDVPEPLRTELIRITSSANAGTIVIADRAGKEQMTQVLARRDAGKKGTPEAEALAHAPSERHMLGVSWIVWAGAILLLIAAGIITAAFVIHW